MEQNTHISEMEPGQQVQGFYVLNDIRCKTSSKGSEFLSAKLMDASGEMDAKLWDYSGPLTSEDSGRVFLLRGQITEYNGTLQFIIQRIRPAESNDNYDIRDLVPTAPLDVDAAVAEVRDILNSIEDSEYRQLCQAMLNLLTPPQRNIMFTKEKQT